MEKVDVLVIGAGLLGCFTARNLARYEMDILVLEKESDVSRGISKANTGSAFMQMNPLATWPSSWMCPSGERVLSWSAMDRGQTGSYAANTMTA